MIEIRLHGAVWRRATPKRRGEWTRTLDELNAENELAVQGALAGELEDDPALELVKLPDSSLLFRLMDGAFDRVAEIGLDGARLAPHFDDYDQAIREMKHLHDHSPARGFETLDYAKRVVHDEGAEYLQEALRAYVEAPLADAKRLFTLIFLIESHLPEELVLFHRFHG